MKILLTTRVIENQAYPERRDALARDWAICAEKFGFLPLLLPNGYPAPADFIQAFSPDGIILTGGDALGATPERDAVETGLLEQAAAQNLPVLGICRGAQAINRHFSGSLVTGTTDNHVATTHEITINDNRLGLATGPCEVNSFHNSLITARTLGPALEPFSNSADGSIEAFQHRSLPIFGVQWHPERPSPQPEINENLIKGWLQLCG